MEGKNLMEINKYYIIDIMGNNMVTNMSLFFSLIELYNFLLFLIFIIWSLFIALLYMNFDSFSPPY